MEITAILLASGEGRRMGCDKLLLDYNNKPIAAYTLNAIIHADVDKRIIVTNSLQLSSLARGFVVVRNPDFGEGQSAAIRKGVLAADPDSGYIFFVADQPLITVGIINGIVALAKENPGKIISAAADGRRGNPVLFPNIFRERLLELKGDTGGREIIANSPEVVLTYETTPERLLDIDTPEDYKSLLRFQQEC